ncbi:hypothetical protein O1611_g5297 [Lasiodiplodia mahajangana]|uniref:Uncharacterized protein n=1 Tax=Lasiodiplodia mahajangana TaxID=1108764 RepID=A0ACC2JM57_9PEZI|nr:hypothetical protein O1611_g5297 [Lasiodiplodia mahajangana]
MPTQTRSRGKQPANTTYRSTAAAPKQQRFSNRRRSVKTYGRTKTSSMKQETLTQMHFTSSAMQEFMDTADDEEGEETKEEEEEEEEKENRKSEFVEPAGKAKPRAKPRSNRRKTAGDELDTVENSRQSKRRKTLGDSPDPSISSSFHTQTLTQMLSTNDENEEPWQIEDSQDDEDSNSIMVTPQKGSRYQSKSEPLEGTESAVPSLIKSATPANRQKKIEIPSTQSPPTPMLRRYSLDPHKSPLMAKSTKVGAASPSLKTLGKIPRNAVIPDSYSTAHDSSPAPTEKSTVKATPSKRLRFDLPDDKENITPGRTKPKSPKPKTQSTGRQPLQEIPDSDEEPYDMLDEDLDETEYETEDDEFGAGDPESPTPKRFQNVVPPVENLEPELERVAEPVALTGSQTLNQKLGLEPHGGASSVLGREVASSPDPSTGPEAETPRPETNIANSVQASTAEQVLENAPSEQDENEDAVDDLSASQDYGYTQGLESQRLPLDSIRALGPQTPHSDIMVSLHPEHIARIVDRTKNHEFRAWKIPQQVSRIWVYITRPESQLRYMCLFGEPKTPGEVEDEKGIGNIEFNQGKKAAKFAYEILQVYELNNPVSLDEMKKKGWVAGAPQKYTYIPPAVVGELTANLRCALFEEETSQLRNSPHKGVSESQELKIQLQNDADYSTQHHSESTDEIIPASQSPRKSNATSETVTETRDFARPPLPRVRSISSNHGSPSLPSQGQRNFVRPSQATTVSQVSSSPVISPGKSGRRPILLSSDTRTSSPTAVRRTQSSLQSSQFPTRSQMLPDSLLNDDIHEPPPIVWDSADEHSD